MSPRHGQLSTTSEAKHIHLEAVYHEVASLIEVECTVGKPTTDEITKSVLCQENSLLRNLFTVDGFGLEK